VNKLEKCEKIKAKCGDGGKLFRRRILEYYIYNIYI
jgi:hypothetical protein